MQNLKDFLEKFGKFKKPNEEIRQYTQQLIKESIEVDVPIELISFRGGVVYVRTSGALKNELAVRKSELLTLLRARFEKFRILDIV